MQVICVSRGTYSGGRDLAERLAAKLGYDCLAREELTDAATASGIPVGRLEMAMVRRRPLSEQLAIDKERFKAFVTATLCERALKSSLVYHGRIGQFVLPGVPHVLRVRAIMDVESRIAATMSRLGLGREKARNYVKDVDEDVRRWVRVMYNIDWDDAANYDFVVNFSHLNVDNAASGLVAMAQLPEFQSTPASTQVLRNIDLSARCRLAIGGDQRTRAMDVQVRADRGRVSISYLPHDERSAQFVPDILRSIEGVDDVVCTMATTNLLWIQERFDPRSASMLQVLEIASKWNAAVDLVRLTEPGTEGPPVSASPGTIQKLRPSEENGGILDDTTDTEIQDEGLRETVGQLIAAGRSGGSRFVRGGPDQILQSLDRSVPYSLVVVGDVFLSKADSVRKRMARELVGYLADHLRVPVVGSEELKTQYLFGGKEWLKLSWLGGLALLLILLVFSYQVEILSFLSAEGTRNRFISVMAISVFAPVFAYIYGNFWLLLLRLFKFE